MFKVLRPTRDAYITNRVVRGDRVEDANVGAAGSLDLFKLYGVTSSGSVENTELSRLLIHFDLEPLEDLINEGVIDTNNTSFSCKLKLFDVYGGQPTPSNFTVKVHPLSRSFQEGLGRDVVYYSDVDVCNYLTGSRTQGPWLLSGCMLGGGLPGSVDYVTASTLINAGASLESSQTFVTGEENLEVDVTTIVSATLAGLLPDEGFRIALDTSHEQDNKTYFVKRFASRAAYNEDKRPRLLVRYDDSVQDDSLALYLDSSSSIFLYNYASQGSANIRSGSTTITGSNSLKLRMVTEISGGYYSLSFSGSQHRIGSNPVIGVYSASVYLQSTDSLLSSKLASSGSIRFTPIWGSLDGTVGYNTGSTIVVRAAQRGGTSLDSKRFTVSVHNVAERYLPNETSVLRVHIFDATSPHVIASRLPTQLPSEVIRDVHHQVRDVVTNDVVIPFDTEFNSTRASSDSSGMFFKLDANNLTDGRSYVIDVMLVTVNSTRKVFKDASPQFRVSSVR